MFSKKTGKKQTKTHLGVKRSYKVQKVPQYTEGNGESLNTRKGQRKDNKVRGTTTKTG